MAGPLKNERFFAASLSGQGWISAMWSYSLSLIASVATKFRIHPLKSGMCSLWTLFLNTPLASVNRFFECWSLSLSETTQWVLTLNWFSKCAELGFSYAGLQFGLECFCGNKSPKPDQKLTDVKCNKPCPGWRMLNDFPVFSTLIPWPVFGC